MNGKADDGSGSVDKGIESAIASLGTLILGLIAAVLIFYMRPKHASSFLIDRRPLEGLAPPGVLTTLVISLFFSSSFWFYSANPDSWAFLFSYYLQDHAKDYSQLLDLEGLLKTISVVAPLGIILYLCARFLSTLLKKFGSKHGQTKTLLFAVSIPYFVVSQGLLLVLGIYKKFSLPEIYLPFVTASILSATLIAVALFVGYSLKLPEIVNARRKATLIITAYLSVLLMGWIAITLPYRVGVGGIANVKLSGPLNLSIHRVGRDDAELDFYMTIQSRSKKPISIVKPKISRILVRPDPLHKDLYEHGSTTDQLVSATSGGNSKIVILKPGEMEWLHFRFSIQGFTHQRAKLFLEDIELSKEESSYLPSKVGFKIVLISDGSMISEEITTWLNREKIKFEE